MSASVEKNIHAWSVPTASRIVANTRRFDILLAITCFSTPLGAGAAVAQDATVQLDTIDVTGRRAAPVTDTGYVGVAGTTASKTDTPLNEVPQSVSTVTHQQIQDRKPQTLLEALGYTPGTVVGSYGFDPRFDAFTVRGIDLTYTGVFRDGLRQLSSPNGLFRLEPYGLESIEILRGPAAAIYGASSTGGIVNLISKRPTETPFHELEVQTGSYGRMQTNFDLSGPLIGVESLSYRITGLVRQAGTQLSTVPDDRAFIAPALTWRPDAATRLTFLGEYMNALTGGSAAYENTYAPYVDADGTVSYKSTGATKDVLADTRYNDFRQQQSRIGYDFEHQFNDIFTLHQNLRYSQLATKEEYSGSGIPGLVKEQNADISVDTYLVSAFATGPFEHKLLTGIDTSHVDYTSNQGYGGVSLSLDPDITFREQQSLDLTGVYVQDQARWQNWRLTVGGRHDWLWSDFASGAPGTDLTHAKQNDGIVTGRAGLSYVTPYGFVPYVSWGTSFVPNAGAVVGGSVAQPTTGEQVEGGVKYTFPQAAASVRAAVFDLTQNNALVYEVVTGVNRQVQLDLHSQGVELEAVASLTDGLDVQASYSYTDARIERLTPGTVGNRLTAIPYSLASVWLNYTLHDGWAQGFGIGGGVRYIGSSLGDNLNRPILDNKSRTLLDGVMRYDLSKLTPKLAGTDLQLNATNLLNDVSQICTSGYCYYGEGRRIIASLRTRW